VAVRGGRCWLMVGGCGERIRGPVRAVGVVGACALRGIDGTSARAAARAGAVRDRDGLGGGLRVRWNGGCGWARMEAAGKGWSAAALGGALRLDRLRYGVGVCVAGWWWCVWWRRDGALVGDLACDAGARWRAAAVESRLVVCAASTLPLSDFLSLLGDFSGAGVPFEGRGDARRDAPWLRGCCEDARVRVGQCGAGGVG
jgi:hypothetical protein